MIHVTVYMNQRKVIHRFYSTSGHAGYARGGKDIVCAAVSGSARLIHVNAIDAVYR